MFSAVLFFCALSLLRENSLWETLKKKLGFDIPSYLVNILTMQGFDNVLSVKDWNDDDLLHLETYVKSENFCKAFIRLPPISKLYRDIRNF